MRYKIINSGIPIGHFQNKEDAQAALRYCSGFIIEDRGV